MEDRMEFPKTIQEFMDGYSFKDDKEIYTNGSQLIPTFRVEQALEHYGQEIRNKAIDDFVKLSKEKWIEHDDLGLSSDFFDYMDEIVQQLKAGGENGNSKTDN